MRQVVMVRGGIVKCVPSAFFGVVERLNFRLPASLARSPFHVDPSARALTLIHVQHQASAANYIAQMAYLGMTQENI